MISKKMAIDIIQSIRGCLTEIEQIIEASPDTGMDELQNVQDGQPAEVLAPVPEEIKTINIDGNQSPWVLALRAKEGKSEIEDEEELTEWLGHNPNDDDEDGLAWCASGLNAALRDAGLPTTGSMAAISFNDYGYECEEKDGAILVFQPKQGKRRISHVCVRVNGNRALGANQGDCLKESNLDYYKQNAELVAVRCPDGYELV